jgi:hypothetical protein
MANKTFHRENTSKPIEPFPCGDCGGDHDMEDHFEDRDPAPVTRHDVARAIYAAAGQHYPLLRLFSWEDLSASSQEYWAGLADAALAVLHGYTGCPPQREA